ncbi:MAG: hypothetical protein LC655_06325, partial [Bacteroidales bacterium]|nr:hypothetical protein [Bacteroidales bacterium]
MLRKYRIVLITVVMLQLGFLVIQLLQQNYFLDDSTEYLRTADNLIGEQMLYCGDADEAIDPALYTKRLPGYPAFLALTRFFTTSMVPVIILQMLLSLGSVLLMLKIFSPGKQDNWLLLPMLLLFPAQFIYSNLVMTEILFQFVLMLAAFRLYRYIQAGKIGMLWLYQLLLIIAILIKPVMYLFIVPNVILFIVLYYRSRQRLVLISSFIPVIFVIILGGVNQQRTGYYHISSIQQINLVDYNLYYFLMDRDGEEAAREAKEQIYATCDAQKDFKERSECLTNSATAVFRDDLKGYALFHLKGMARFFVDPGRFDLYHFFGIERERGKGFLYHLNEGGFRAAWSYFVSQPVLVVIALLLIALLNLLRLLGFLAFLFNRHFKPEFRLFLFF